MARKVYTIVRAAIQIIHKCVKLKLYHLRKDTCPECRSKTNNSSVLRLFVNIVDSSYSVNGDDPTDLVGLQSENDHLKFRLIEKDGIIKSKEETLNRLQDENKKLTHGQFQSRTVIQKLEQRQEQHNLLTIAQNDQVGKCRNTNVDTLFISLFCR